MYVFSKLGLLKVGNGTNGSLCGKIYCRNNQVIQDSLSWIFLFEDKIFIRQSSTSSPLFLVVRQDNLEVFLPFHSLCINSSIKLIGDIKQDGSGSYESCDNSKYLSLGPVDSMNGPIFCFESMLLAFIISRNDTSFPEFFIDAFDLNDNLNFLFSLEFYGPNKIRKEGHGSLERKYFLYSWGQNGITFLF